MAKGARVFLDFWVWEDCDIVYGWDVYHRGCFLVNKPNQSMWNKHVHFAVADYNSERVCAHLMSMRLCCMCHSLYLPHTLCIVHLPRASSLLVFTSNYGPFRMWMCPEEYYVYVRFKTGELGECEPSYIYYIRIYVHRICVWYSKSVDWMYKQTSYIPFRSSFMQIRCDSNGKYSRHESKYSTAYNTDRHDPRCAHVASGTLGGTSNIYFLGVYFTCASTPDAIAFPLFCDASPPNDPQRRRRRCMAIGEYMSPVFARCRLYRHVFFPWCACFLRVFSPHNRFRELDRHKACTLFLSIWFAVRKWCCHDAHVHA